MSATDLTDAIEARYDKALDAKPGKGPIVKVEALWDSACDVPGVTAALRAVLDLHVSDEWPTLPICKECSRLFPCPTVRAITTHLEGAS